MVDGDAGSKNSGGFVIGSKTFNRKNLRGRKQCVFCAKKSDILIDYKESLRLKKFMSERSKILPRRVTGVCARHQRLLALSIERARYLALVPYVTS